MGQHKWPKLLKWGYNVEIKLQTIWLVWVNLLDFVIGFGCLIWGLFQDIGGFKKCENQVFHQGGQAGGAAHTRVDPSPPTLIAGNAPLIAHHHTGYYPTKPPSTLYIVHTVMWTTFQAVMWTHTWNSCSYRPVSYWVLPDPTLFTKQYPHHYWHTCPRHPHRKSLLVSHTR